MRLANLAAPDFDHASEREGYVWRGAQIGDAIGSAQIGGSVYELPDGQKTYPFHFHHGTEEWLIVIAGSPVLRSPEGERTLRSGDVVCFPTGPDGAHQIWGPGTVLVLSANRTPETVEYPDSGKVGTRPPRKLFRAADAVDYWDGE